MKGIHHLELSVIEYEKSVAFFDKMFGWLGYKSFWTLDIEYRSTYYMARFPFFHSYIGIQPARTGKKLVHGDHSTGLHHVALWARNRKEVDDFHTQFLLKNDIAVTDAPAEYPTYTPGYYAVFFDDPFTGIHFELSYTPTLPSPSSYLRRIRALKAVWAEHPEWKLPPWKKAMRNLASRREAGLTWHSSQRQNGCAVAPPLSLDISAGKSSAPAPLQTPASPARPRQESRNDER